MVLWYERGCVRKQTSSVLQVELQGEIVQVKLQSEPVQEIFKVEWLALAQFWTVLLRASGHCVMMVSI